MISVDAGDLTKLAGKLGESPARLISKGQVALLGIGTGLRDGWRSNAKQTAGKHGRWYPRAIQARPAGVLAVDVGPKPGMKQASMSFEFGSRNQPPHLDGQRALDAALPGIEKVVGEVAIKALD